MDCREQVASGKVQGADLACVQIWVQLAGHISAFHACGWNVVVELMVADMAGEFRCIPKK